jgi:hypothetical protein
MIQQTKLHNTPLVILELDKFVDVAGPTDPLQSVNKQMSHAFKLTHKKSPDWNGAFF